MGARDGYHVVVAGPSPRGKTVPNAGLFYSEDKRLEKKQLVHHESYGKPLPSTTWDFAELLLE
ncbi:hypothetical protein DXG01_004877 [Tephrocybe rancida]|nr:hypothetical protein DXG01_004877 [Tephrocybe rancida]